MNKIVLLLFVAIFSLDYLALKLELISRELTLFPELLSMLVMLSVVGLFTVKGRAALGPKYFILLGVLLLHITIGIVINFVSPGVIVAGIRNYLKFLPFFLLPAVYNFSDAQIKSQLRLLLVLVLLQSPLAIYQRLIQFAHKMHTGDVITGTLNTSGALTIALIAAIAVLMAFYLKKRIPLPVFLLFAFLLFIPTTINETKISLILLPIALLIPVFLVSESKAKFRQVVMASALCAVTMIAFVGVYNHFIQFRSTGVTLEEFFGEKEQVETYVYRRVDPDGYFKHVGRVDSMVLPVKVLSDDVIKLGFGLGIGNVSESFLPSFSGEYMDEYARLGIGMTTLGDLIWEIGVVGLLLYLIFFYMVFRDACYLSKRDGICGAFGLGWGTVVMIMTISLAYKSVFQFNELGYLFWYFSGYVTATRYRIENDTKQKAPYVRKRTVHSEGEARAP